MGRRAAWPALLAWGARALVLPGEHGADPLSLDRQLADDLGADAAVQLRLLEQASTGGLLNAHMYVELAAQRLEAMAGELQRGMRPGVTLEPDEPMINAGGGLMVPVCKMGPGEPCALPTLQQGMATAVLPGGETGCILGGQFAFQVWPGAADRLEIFFDGGGACWDSLTTSTGACGTGIMTTDLMGTFNTCPGEPNPVKDHTVIFVNSCSGDLHAGNATRPHLLGTARASGLQNTRSVLEWVKANLAPRLSSLVLAGESAGAIGAQVWARQILTELPHDRAAVFSDSYMGIFPPGFQERLFLEFNVCDSGLLTAEQSVRCRAKELNIIDLFDETMRDFPDVSFATLNSKHDVMQITFSNVALVSMGARRVTEFCNLMMLACNKTHLAEDPEMSIPMVISPVFHKRMEDIVERYGKNPNYASYLMSGAMHSISTKVFGDCPGLDYGTISYTGFLGDDGDDRPRAAARGAQRIAIRHWLADLMVSDAPLASVCEERAPEDEDDYCVAEQRAKTLRRR